MKRLDKRTLKCALKVRTDIPGAPPVRDFLIATIQRFHLWLPSERISDAQMNASPMRGPVDPSPSSQ